MPKSQGNFQNSLCLPPNLKKATLMTVISVGNTLQEGANFSYFVDLVKQEFEKGSLEKLIIVTTGHLQRHYFSLGLDKPLTEEEIEEKANAIDNKWLEENEIYLQQSKIHYKKKTWKEVLNLQPISDFDTFLQVLTKHYHENKSFKKAITKHVRGYVSRKIKHFLNEMGRQVEFNAFMEVAIDYILEELAAAVQLQKCGADFFTYPGSMNPPACYLVKHFPRETALKYIVYKPQECERSNEDKPQTIASLFFPSQPQSQSQHVSIQYAQWLLDRANWNKKQKEQFIHGLNQLLTSINASTQPTEPVSSINKPIARRASI